ncbi:MAG: hypothetical protein IT310_07665 [Anaerolineales bacterium]|nr:hypothetical protein [Anaerolineales bacterium]
MWKFNKLQSVFLILFLLSTLFFFTLPLMRSGSSPAPSATGNPSVIVTPEDPNAPDEPSATPASQNATALIGSLVASLTSLIGFAVTTIITWRKEKRESALANLQQKKLQAELEKSKLELEALKNKSPKKKKK